MYASDLTLKKRNQTIFSDISRQKVLFNEGAIFRMNYQKGGTDYAYMMELEQGCINNKCFGIPLINNVVGNGKTTMDIGGAVYVDPAGLIDYGYILPAHINPLETGDTMDDVYLPLPMGTTSFNFFGQQYDSTNVMYWSTNCCLIFQNPGQRVVTFQPSPYPAILLGNGDRRLNNLYVRDDSIVGKYSILTLFVFYENFSSTVSIPGTGQYQVRIIRELTGSNRQWIEVRVAIAPPFSGYISGQQDTNNVFTDATKLSPYNITDGTRFLNPCGSTFDTVGPASGTSFTFQSESTGNFWIFNNNSYVPV